MPKVAIRLHTHCGRGHELTSENVYTRPDGKRRQCRLCKLEANRAWRRGEAMSVPFTHCRQGHLLTLETTHQLNSGGRACSICQSQRQKEQYITKGMRFTRHGITEQEFLTILEKQGGHCPICDNVLIPTEAVIDHDHQTNKVRGLLCVNCNTGLGKLGDSIPSLIKAVRYLNDHSH